MRRTPSVLVGSAAGVLLLAGLVQPGPAASAPRAAAAAAGPDRVVVILVDGLSKQIVRRYRMENVQRLMRQGVDTPNGYLGHTSAVTVVTHNVVTSGLFPKNAGWSDEGYRDVDNVLTSATEPDNHMWITSNFGATEAFALQEHAGSPKLADYLHMKRPDSKVVTVSPKGYAAYAMGGEGSDSIVTFSSRKYDCDSDGIADEWRGPDGVNVPPYLSSPECGRWYVDSASAQKYDTDRSPAWLYPLDGDRYTVGFDPAHRGGDVWAADAAIEVMRQEGDDWSGIFVSLPGVDKAAHMWGGIDDPGGPVPMTHMPRATEVADHQVGRIIDQLEDLGQLDNTLVVLTADHGFTPGRHFHGVDADGQGFFNWYWGDPANDGVYDDPQPALRPLVDPDGDFATPSNVKLTYSDSMVRAWLDSRTRADKLEAAAIMAKMPQVSATWIRTGDRFQRASPVRWGRMKPAEQRWFRAHAHELLNTAAADHGSDVVATLVDNTTYSVAGDHGGIQRTVQKIPIVFAGGGVSRKDLKGPVRSVDITPTVLRALGIPVTAPIDGKGYKLPGLG